MKIYSNASLFLNLFIFFSNSKNKLIVIFEHTNQGNGSNGEETAINNGGFDRAALFGKTSTQTPSASTSGSFSRNETPNQVFVLILSFTFKIKSQKTNVGNVLIGYLKFLNTKLQMNNNVMSVDDEIILKVIIEIMAKEKKINQVEMRKADHLLRSISMRLGIGEMEKLTATPKHMHWRQGR